MCWGLIVVEKEDAVVGAAAAVVLFPLLAGVLLSSWGGFDRGLAGNVENHYSFLRGWGRHLRWRLRLHSGESQSSCWGGHVGVCVCAPVSPKNYTGSGDSVDAGTAQEPVSNC